MSDEVAELERRGLEHRDWEDCIHRLQRRVRSLERSLDRVSRAAEAVHDGAPRESWHRLENALDESDALLHNSSQLGTIDA